MNKKLHVISLAILITGSCNNLYAHEANPDFEKRETEHQEKSEQKDRETWDDFMSAVKAQENKHDNTEASDTTASEHGPKPDH